MMHPNEDSLIIRLLESTDSITTEDQFKEWINTDLQVFFPHGAFICGIGRLHKKGISPVKLIASNFPDDYLTLLKQPDGLIFSSVINNWLRTAEVQLVDPNTPGFSLHPGLDSAWLKKFKSSGLKNLAAHGLLDYTRHYISYFSFHQIPGFLSTVHCKRLKILVPFLNAALLRVLHVNRANIIKAHALQPLTERELEVLTWVGEGKTSAEIASILGIARNTVRNQIQSTLIKLRVNTRSQAVAKAIKKGLVTPRQVNSQFGPFR